MREKFVKLNAHKLQNLRLQKRLKGAYVAPIVDRKAPCTLGKDLRKFNEVIYFIGSQNLRTFTQIVIRQNPQIFVTISRR